MKILNNAAKFYRKHRKAVNIGGIIIIGCLLVYGVFGFFTENTASPIYGNRLEGIKKVEIKKDKLKEAEENLLKDENVEEVEIVTEGKMITATIKVKNEVDLDGAKKSVSKITSEFNEDELGFYDIELYVYKEDETKNNFPIIGHKKCGKDNISWTKDRGVE